MCIPLICVPLTSVSAFPLRVCTPYGLLICVPITYALYVYTPYMCTPYVCICVSLTCVYPLRTPYMCAHYVRLICVYPLYVYPLRLYLCFPNVCIRAIGIAGGKVCLSRPHSLLPPSTVQGRGGIRGGQYVARQHRLYEQGHVETERAAGAG
jgi:hypothetical protein